MDKYEDYGAHVVPGKRRTNYPSIAPEIEHPPSEAASSSHHEQTKGQPQKGKGKGRGKVNGHAGRQTWEQTNNYARDWQPAAMNMNSYDATFRDGQWINPRHRRDPGRWEEPYWNNPRTRTARRSWRAWDHDQGKEHHDDDERNDEEEDTGR